MIFEPIDNQKVAELAGYNYDQSILKPGKLIYGITHLAPSHFAKIRNCGRCILLTSFSDASVTSNMARRMPKNIVKWFSTNVLTKNPRVEAMPIGFAFKRDHQNLAAELRKTERPKQKNLMYVNFFRHIPRTPNPREGMYEQFGGKSWTTAEGGLPDSYTSVERFYQGVREHPFVLSPPGAGLDCHRHWESIALGSIPIVMRSKAVEILEDMPCLIVDHWDDVTEVRLLEELPRLKERFSHTSMQKQNMWYWRGRIKDEVASL